LNAWRAARGWTQGELAAKVNYSESLIALVETCRSAATMELGRGLDRVFSTPGYAPANGDKPETPGTFMRLAVRISFGSRCGGNILSSARFRDCLPF